MTVDPYTLDPDLRRMAMIPDFGTKLAQLSSLAEPEDWDYHVTSSPYPLPILFNYLTYTWRRVAEEKKFVVSEDARHACWNTGLVAQSQEPVFMLFEENKLPTRTNYWHFGRFCRQGESHMNRFKQLPEMAHYYDDPAALVYDTRRELRINVEHIVSDNLGRFPAALQAMNPFGIQNILKGAVDSAVERVRRNYKAAIPQYYQGAIQLLLPLCLTDPKKADLALTVERYSDVYRAATCLTLEMAYNNARQLARPDRDWLQP